MTGTPVSQPGGSSGAVIICSLPSFYESLTVIDHADPEES